MCPMTIVVIHGMLIMIYSSYMASFRFLFTNNKRSQVQIRGNGVMTTEEGENDHMIDIDLINQHMTKEQFNYLIQMAKQKSINGSTIKGSGINSNVVVGIMLKYFGTFLSIFNSSTLIMDSGASDHMCYNSSSFVSMTVLKVPININLPNSQFILVTYLGSSNS